MQLDIDGKHVHRIVPIYIRDMRFTMASIVALPLVLGCIASSKDTVPPMLDSVAVAAPVQQGLKPPSELALLMRVMVTFSDSTKSRIKRGDELLPFPADFKAIHTAAPTDGQIDMERATYDQFADHYLSQVDALYAAAKADRDRIFNGTLGACANCHTVVCPGPMARIKKMYLRLPASSR